MPRETIRRELRDGRDPDLIEIEIAFLKAGEGLLGVGEAVPEHGL